MVKTRLNDVRKAINDAIAVINRDLFYTPESVMKKTDLTGKEPMIYLISSNRSAGKTSFFLETSIILFQKYDKKTILIYRNQYELQGAAKIYGDVLQYYHDNIEIEMRSIAKGLIYEMCIGEKTLGYCLSLSNVDSIKKYSPLFGDVELFIFDEFQTENGKYLKNEFVKLNSLLISCLRGKGKQFRDNAILVMIANNIDLMNPYYIGFGIYKRLSKKTKIMRGDGWIAEFSHNNVSQKALEESPIARAFASSKYTQSMSSSEYFIDSNKFLYRPNGKNRYLFTIVYDGKLYGVRDFYEDGTIYVNNKHEPSFPIKVSFKDIDHNAGFVKGNKSPYFMILKESYENAYLSFSDLSVKNAIFDILAINYF